MAKSKSVLLISGEYPPMEGGVADFTQILAEHLIHEGCQVSVLTSVDCIGTSTADIQVYPLMKDWGARSLFKTFRRLLDEVKPDVVDIQYQTAAYNLHPAINLLPRTNRHIPFVTTFHDLRVPYIFPKAGKLRWRVNRMLAESSRAAIVTNAQDREQLAQSADVDILEMIPIGSNIEAAELDSYDRGNWRGSWAVASNALLLSYFGFLNESKGAEELIEALDLVCQSGYDAHLMMIGGAIGASDPTNREYFQVVRTLIDRLDLRDKMIWTGYLPAEEVSAAFYSTDVCVLPFRDGASFRRGSLMAALSHGVPVITTEPEVPLPELSHGHNIWLVPPRNPQALERAIAYLAESPEVRKRLGQGARELSQLFGWDHIARRTLQVYRRISDE